MKEFLKNLIEKFFTVTLSKWQIKFTLALSAIVIVFAVVAFTQYTINELVHREQKMIAFFTDLHKYYSDPSTNIEDYFFFLQKITPTITFPFIMTDENDEPIYPYLNYTLNIDFDSSSTISEQKQQLKKMIKEMGKTYPPKVIRDADGKVLMKFFYTYSALVKNLRLFPIISIIIIFAVIIVGFLAFSNIRKNEESKVWVGMAKEAAHQLGTPLSSMMAWLEIIKLNKNDPDYILATVDEMGSDINRLKTIATRFSKIGSVPEKEIADISKVVGDTCSYFEKRLPHLGKKIEIIKNIQSGINSEINVDLIHWVIENLLKNAAEAIETKKGEVYVSISMASKNRVLIIIRDTGKGMAPKVRRQIFHPGYTTKKRGWGLGLSLCKRIVEDYHNGKILVKETSVGKGTTFVIELNTV